MIPFFRLFDKVNSGYPAQILGVFFVTILLGLLEIASWISLGKLKIPRFTL